MIVLMRAECNEEIGFCYLFVIILQFLSRWDQSHSSFSFSFIWVILTIRRISCLWDALFIQKSHFHDATAENGRWYSRLMNTGWLLPAARRKTPLLKNHHLKLPIRLTRWHPFSLTLLEAPNESGWQAESTRLLTLKIIITEKIWKWVKK
ncbi:hypothetical protein P9302_13190 [Brevibacillus agri]|uniref:hypothetical protein n=1 Tax=Brevibacillus agri TaxID=51101 RepID=UPI002E237E93|nr:hypothetical protein [Brevibacillus agri]